MTRLDRTKRIAPAEADHYAEVGRRLLLAGRAILERGDPRHAPALAILGVHAAIAYADALCIHLGGRKSTSSDHGAGLRLLKATMGSRLSPQIERSTQRLMAEKDRFEYQGYVATMGEAAALFAKAERFGTWADQVLVSMRRAG